MKIHNINCAENCTERNNINFYIKIRRIFYDKRKNYSIYEKEHESLT